MDDRPGLRRHTIEFEVHGRSAADVDAAAREVLADYLDGAGRPSTVQIDVRPAVTAFDASTPAVWVATVFARVDLDGEPS